MSARDRKKKLIENFKRSLDDVLFRVEILVGTAEQHHLTDEQFYLDFEDRLNELSIKEHPSKELVKQ